jgi:bifunctional DNA-binding transcriptional regulator/antitoxin component of YhaV-PrlF toxin-antitoxin module
VNQKEEKERESESGETKWATATVRMRKDGVVWVPAAVRKLLGIYKKGAILEIKVKVVGKEKE